MEPFGDIARRFVEFLGTVTIETEGDRYIVCEDDIRISPYFKTREGAEKFRTVFMEER